MRLATAIPACLGMLVYIHLVGFGPDRALLIWLASAIAITAAVSGAFTAAFGGLERMEYVAYAGLVGNGLMSLLGIVLVLLGYRVVALMELATMRVRESHGIELHPEVKRIGVFT